MCLFWLVSQMHVVNYVVDFELNDMFFATEVQGRIMERVHSLIAWPSQ